MAEECFICQDSGLDLCVCNSRNCLKAHHPGYVRNKDEGFICELPVPADDHESDENAFDNGANDQTIPFDSKGKQIKANTSLNKSNKRTCVGWGSKELIEFLSNLRKDTSKPLDELEIIGLVKGYIKEKKLYQDDKKVRFLCDAELQPLFTRRIVKCKSIRKLLAVHLASNALSEDESFYSYEDDDDDASIIKNRPCNSVEPKIAKRVSQRSKRHFASLIQNNINLIYMRRTLVVSLLSQPDTFEQKVVGCFVRVRCSKMVHTYEIPKKAYLLRQVTGIKRCEKEYKIKDKCTHILLCVSGLLDEVSISMLSDEDLEEDECEDLMSLAEKGLLKRATVAELEEKVAIVHKDIVNHWIERELVKLERKIDDAQMKGLREEMEKLLNQKKLLSTPAERQRRLEEVPEIVPDTEYSEKETELQVAAANSSQGNRVVSMQGDGTRDEVDPGVDWSVVNSDASKEKRDAEEETLSLRTSPKRGAQSPSETSEPKKLRLSAERALPEACADADALEPQGQVPATGEPWAEPAQVSSPRADETIVAATELVAGPSSWPACLVASRALVRAVEYSTDDPDLDDDADLAAWLRSEGGARRAQSRVWAALQLLMAAASDLDGDVLALGPRLRESWAAKSRALQSAAEERRRREELSAELASAERALREARSEAERHQAEARRAEQGWSTELADVRRQLEDALVAVEDVGDSAAQVAQAAAEESARLVAQLEELRRGKAASEAAAQESARRVEALKTEMLNAEAARESSERARQVAEAGLIGCKELIRRLERQFCSCMEERRKLEAQLEGIQQLSAEALSGVRTRAMCRR